MEIIHCRNSATPTYSTAQLISSKASEIISKEVIQSPKWSVALNFTSGYLPCKLNVALYFKLIEVLLVIIAEANQSPSSEHFTCVSLSEMESGY
jgi:hypothetical protein